MQVKTKIPREILHLVPERLRYKRSENGTMSKDDIEDIFMHVEEKNLYLLHQHLERPKYPSKEEIEKHFTTNDPFQKGVKIAQLLNGEDMEWENREQTKYIVSKMFKDGQWVFDITSFLRDAAHHPIQLCFRHLVLAIKAYQMFPEVWNDIYGFKTELK